MSPRSLHLFLALFLLTVSPGRAQEAALPFTPIPLDDLSAFRSAGANWSVAGGVAIDRRLDGDLRPLSGTGVLVNLPAADHYCNLFTEMEHGDVEIELDFVVPKGSNSGIYLMGRYEVQIYDSWAADPPRFSDAGGIYQRWDESRGPGREGFEGHQPRINASRAPGLWQHLRILFRAPRFDDRGGKVADARFLLVEHNGAVVHENVAVTGPTRSAAFEDERPEGPLMLQGDHGPVAFRNIRVKRFGGEPARLVDLRYRAYMEPTLDFSNASLRGEGAATSVAGAHGGDRDRFGLIYEGRLHAPTAGDYLFDLGLEWVDNDPHFEGDLTGAGRIYVDNREVVRHEGLAPNAEGIVSLSPGIYPFRLVVFKDRPWNDPRMTLYVEGPGFPRRALHDVGALPATAAPGAITVSGDVTPVVQRTFIVHENRKRTHAAAVGDPAGVHYAVDLANGGLLYAWRGPFIEATPMWHERGSDQISIPLGSVVSLGGESAVARLSALDAPSPSVQPDFAFGGYALDSNGRPTFSYRIGSAGVEDELRPDEGGRSLHRNLRITGGDGLAVRLAEAARIVPADGGGFRVDEAYYVEPDAGMQAIILHVDGRDELRVIVPNGAIERIGYTILW